MTDEEGVAQAATPRSAEMILEEYKLINERTQFVMTRYMQALALYLTFVGLGIKEVLDSNTPMRTMVLATALTCGNILTFYAAMHFRRMAYHALDRQTKLAEELGFQPPYPMIWGYHVGICAFAVVQIVLAVIAVKTLLP